MRERSVLPKSAKNNSDQTGVQILNWNKGKPPHIGWWNASRAKQPNMWRWWDGRLWSEATPERTNAYTAAQAAKRVALKQGEIKWTWYWPENARVERRAL
jgi:hypothetical protein